MTVKNLPSPVVEQKEQVLDATQIEAAVGDPTAPYKVGPGDVLMIVVFNHPELAIGTYNTGIALSPNARTTGLLIDNDGSIQLPLIGSVNVAGKSVGELRQYIEGELGKFIKDPHVTVQVVFDGSIRYYLFGQFAVPGLKYADRPMRLLEAMTLGGSILLQQASLPGAYLSRGGKRLPVNFQRLIREGDMKQNIMLQTDDTIVVPDNANEQVFVFAGAAGGSHGGAVPMPNGHLDLLQALAVSGIGYQERAQGRLDQVRVIRAQFDRGQFFVVNAEKMLDGEAGLFPLMPGDIIFVPESGVTKWNQIMNQLLPTLQVFSALLNPFVQIEYLNNNH